MYFDLFSRFKSSSIYPLLNLFGHKTWNVLWISFLYLDLLSRIFHLHLFKELNAGELFVERRQEYITEKRKGKKGFCPLNGDVKWRRGNAGRLGQYFYIFLISILENRFQEEGWRDITNTKSVVAEGLGHSFCLWILFVFLVGWIERN